MTPKQSMRVLTPLVLLFACVLASSLVNGATTDKKVTNALKFILKSEGGCQNSASDSGNKMTIGGKSVVGYTCAGLTPGNAWTYRKEFGAKCAASCKAQDKFSKCCYDLDSKAYTDNVGNVYQKFFFKTGGCDTYADPTYTACADGTMNGIKTANTIKAWEKAHPYSKKSSEQAFCTDISEVIRCQSYEPAGNVEKNKKFMGGWRNRSFERECICKGLTRGSAACTAHVKARNAEVEKNTNCKKYGGKDELNKSASGKKTSSASKQSSNKKPASTGNKKPAANSKKPSNKKASGNKK